MNEHQAIQKLQNEVRVLRWSLLILASLMAVVWFGGFSPNGDKQHFDEIDVERMNIVNAEGRYCFVLTNGSRAPGAIIGGKEIRRANSNGIPSMIFYNEEGDESGALVTAGKMKDDGTYYGSSRLVFDRFRRDETLALQYYEDPIGGYSGMLLQDTPEIFTADWLEGNESIRAMPEGPEKTEALKKFRESTGVGARRLFVGKNRSRSVTVDLADTKGNTRLRMVVDSLGTPHLDFLNENGVITYSLPDALRTGTKQ